MIITPARTAHLTYCSNIHPGESWTQVRANLERYVVAVKARVAPTRPFGVGLRLSGAAVRALSEPGALAELREFLAAHGLYVFTLNGFPYGTFHGQPVKEAVYLPDWLDPERLAYTDQLARVLAQLLPEEPELEGSVSTVPGAFKARARGDNQARRIAAAILAHAATLYQIHRHTGKLIALALEPEPCCLLETVAETVAFFRDHLLSRPALARFGELTGLDPRGCEAAVRRHVGVCLDTCHAAVELEDPVAAIAALRGAGIRIAKVQLSAGLRVAAVDADAIDELAAFVDDVYLHQVVERSAAGVKRYVDLPEAIAGAQARPDLDREWRIHFHVPLFLAELGRFENTQGFVREVLREHAKQPVSQHLEVETYTWDVLPRAYRTTDVVTAVGRELGWVMDTIARGAA